jgi:Chain length determinant protein
VSKQSLNQSINSEISLVDMVYFLRGSYRTILGVGLLGLFAATGFLVITPYQYEATAQIQIAQINHNPTNPLGINLEDPNLMMFRLKQPSTYSDLEIRACSFGNKKISAESISSMAKFSMVKGVSSVIELKIKLESKEQAVICAKAIFENIRESQNQIIRPFIQQTKVLLKNYQARIKEIQDHLARADISGDTLTVASLLYRDEARFLTEESVRLNNLLITVDANQTKLVSSIYISDIPVFPKKKIILITGLLSGMFLGLVLMMIRKAWEIYKVN